MIVYTICIFIFIPNLMGISLQKFLPKSDFYQILTAINLTDMTYGVYLMFLLIGDQHYVHKFIWKASPLCFFILLCSISAFLQYYSIFFPHYAG